MVTKSGGIGLASGAATMVLAQQIEQKFVRQIAQSFIAKNLLPGLARGSLSGATASSGIGAVAVLGFVAKDYFTDQISADEALIQSGIGLGSAGVGFGVGVIATMATAGTILGTSVPIVGNAFGFVVGALAGAAVYAGGDWYYENPVRIIQRFGRIDRIGSASHTVQLVNFWPTQDLDKYVNLKNRVEARMALVDIAATFEDNILKSDEIEELIHEDMR